MANAIVRENVQRICHGALQGREASRAWKVTRGYLHFAGADWVFVAVSFFLAPLESLAPVFSEICIRSPSRSTHLALTGALRHLLRGKKPLAARLSSHRRYPNVRALSRADRPCQLDLPSHTESFDIALACAMNWVVLFFWAGRRCIVQRVHGFLPQEIEFLGWLW